MRGRSPVSPAVGETRRRTALGNTQRGSARQSASGAGAARFASVRARSMILLRHGESLFNAAFNTTRVDPGIFDPGLTPSGREQAMAAAARLADRPLHRLIVSPYRRALETAEIIAAILPVPVSIEPLVREQTHFTCDVGTPRSLLAERWPQWQFDHLAEIWWPSGSESEAESATRCQRFRAAMAESADWPGVAVVSHWAFIRGLAGIEVGNGESIAFDPVRGARRVPDAD